jgi:anionic cell wall polymer biosynthesis LytR-Cps2A-Psr (LCP) family protein
VYIRLDQDGFNTTIAEAYGRLGREGLTARLERLFNTSIGSYLAVDQSTLDKVSEVVGPVLMEGKVTTMADIFEGTYTDGEIEPQTEIRRLAASLLEPRILVKAPQLARILTSDVKTNLGYKNILGIYRVVAQQGPEVLQKKALTGRDYYQGNRKYREVPPEAWVSVLNDATKV